MYMYFYQKSSIFKHQLKEKGSQCSISFGLKNKCRTTFSVTSWTSNSHDNFQISHGPYTFTLQGFAFLLHWISDIYWYVIRVVWHESRSTRVVTCFWAALFMILYKPVWRKLDFQSKLQLTPFFHQALQL